jgi:uncharacterized membrane protein
MAAALEFPTTRQGIRDLDQPRRSRVNVGGTERAFSSVGGALLAGLGAGRGGLGGLGGLALAALGAALIYRGQTGHCSLYAAAGIDTAHG